MSGRELMLFYGAAAAGVTWLLLTAYGKWVERRSLLQPVLLVVFAISITAFVARVVQVVVRPQPLDLEFYPITARVFMFVVFWIFGWMVSISGLRRWRSGVSLKESRAAYREGLWAGFEARGQLLVRAGLVAIGVAMALPEWLFGH